jgi:hypothetical protein
MALVVLLVWSGGLVHRRAPVDEHLLQDVIVGTYVPSWSIIS